MKRYALHLVSLLSLALAMACFIPQRAAADDDDPPGRVARLGFVRGTVSFEPAGTEDWVSAVVNRPLTTGDKLWNDADSFSELHLGSASIRLGSNTGFTFLNLTDNTTQVRLTEGTLNIRVRRLGDDETFEVDTPNLAFTLLRPGNYKVNVNEAGDATVVIVRDGQGEVTGGGSAYTVHPQEVGTFNGTDQIDADVESWDNSSDDFDNWCAERDARIDNSVSARYVSNDVIGYEDLDEYGGWRPTPEYGTVWFPHVAVVGWAPYHYGHWAYIAPWGYTWVDDAPWGFAPFHYGRWVTVGGVWGWVPAPPRSVAVGAVYVRPVYAPALVAWVGGPHFAVGIGIGGGFAAGVSVGWFPLGPREVYVPSYHVSRAYVTNINVSNTRVETTVVNNYYNTTVINKTTVTNVTYVNQRVTGAVSVTTPQAFTSAQSVSRNSVSFNAREVASAPVVATTPAVVPSRQAVLGAGVTADSAASRCTTKPRSSCKDGSSTAASVVREAAGSNSGQRRQTAGDVRSTSAPAGDGASSPNIKSLLRPSRKRFRRRVFSPTSKRPVAPVNAVNKSVKPPVNEHLIDRTDRHVPTRRPDSAGHDHQRKSAAGPEASTASAGSARSTRPRTTKSRAAAINDRADLEQEGC